MPEKSIDTRILKMEPIDWRNLQFIQQGDFKELPALARHKLKGSLVANNFVEPFYVWESQDGVLYCLDGKHRTEMLEELIKEGYEVPYQLPANFVQCDDKKAAAKLVLVFSSMYARVTEDGLNEFIRLQDLDLEELSDQIDIPYLEDTVGVLPIPDDLEGDGKNKPAVMRITFESPEELEAATAHIDAILKDHFPGAFYSVSCGEI